MVPLDSDQRVIANKSTSAVLSFQIDNAAPPVSTSNIRWFYSPNLPPSLFAEGNDFQEITNLMNRTSKSTLEFTNGFLNLTIGNIVQARPETDTGRYFLEATNQAGVDSSYIDLVVFGKYIRVYSSWESYVYSMLSHILESITVCLRSVIRMYTQSVPV